MLRKRWSRFAVALALLVALSCGDDGGGDIETDAARSLTIVAIGDSIVRGGDDGGWVGRLQARLDATTLGARVINQGIDGDTARGVLNRLGAAVAAQPHVLIVCVGTNDLVNFAGRAPVAAAAAGFGQAIESIVAEIGARQPEARVYLIAVPPLDTALAALTYELPFGADAPGQAAADAAVRGYNEALARAAMAAGATYVEVAWPTGLGRRPLLADGIHPTAAGYDLIAAAVYDALSVVLAG
jgi:lysophospholipase L1-like esterase